MGCLALIGSVLAVALALWWSYTHARRVNEMQVQLDALARAKGITPTQHWRAEIKGVKEPLLFPASNEGDALRQLLVERINPADILSLTQAQAPTVDPMAGLAVYRTKQRGKK